jgi:hypothetical protein
MGKKVDLVRFAEALGDYPFGYLITVDDDFHAHTVAVEPVFADGVLHLGPAGEHTRANLDRHPRVSLVWPPVQPGGYSLMLDGRGELSDDAQVRVFPSKALLHRRAQPGSAAAATGCLHDCVVFTED